MGAVRIYGTVNHGSTATLLRRVKGWTGQALRQADISSIRYTIKLIDERDEADNTVVSGHSAVAVSVATSVYDTLQTDDRWTPDATGYNFAHTPDVAQNQAFSEIGRRYLVEYTLTPASGQVIVLQFVLTCI
jgi:hypothetical protein